MVGLEDATCIVGLPCAGRQHVSQYLPTFTQGRGKDLLLGARAGDEHARYQSVVDALDLNGSQAASSKQGCKDAASRCSTDQIEQFACLGSAHVSRLDNTEWQTQADR
jgi:hypothetical protein